VVKIVYVYVRLDAEVLAIDASKKILLGPDTGSARDPYKKTTETQRSALGKNERSGAERARRLVGPRYL
jgi:hypothetical protein